jgi:hypothetical protein
MIAKLFMTLLLHPFVELPPVRPTLGGRRRRSANIRDFRHARYATDGAKMIIGI